MATSHTKHNFVLAGKLPDVAQDRGSTLRFADFRKSLSQKSEQIVAHRMRHFPCRVDFWSPRHAEHPYKGSNSLGSHFTIQNITGLGAKS
jgi:hypothetical protein